MKLTAHLSYWLRFSNFLVALAPKLVRCEHTFKHAVAINIWWCYLIVLCDIYVGLRKGFESPPDWSLPSKFGSSPKSCCYKPHELLAQSFGKMN